MKSLKNIGSFLEKYILLVCLVALTGISTLCYYELQEIGLKLYSMPSGVERIGNDLARIDSCYLARVSVMDIKSGQRFGMSRSTKTGKVRHVIFDKDGKCTSWDASPEEQAIYDKYVVEDPRLPKPDAI